MGFECKRLDLGGRIRVDSRYISNESSITKQYPNIPLDSVKVVSFSST